MTIETKNYIIRSDGLSYWMLEKFVSKKNQEKGMNKISERRVSGYFSHIEDVIKDYFTTELYKSESTDEKELFLELERINKKMIQMSEEIGNIIKSQMKELE